MGTGTASQDGKHVHGQSLRNWLKTQISHLRTHYKSISDDDEPIWIGELKQLEAEVGWQRAEKAVAEFLRKVADFPNIAKLREFIPPPDGRMTADRNCPKCGGTGFERCRHCDCRKQMLTDTGLDGEADPTCQICKGRGSLVDQEPRKNNRVRTCSCKQVMAQAAQ